MVQRLDETDRHAGIDGPSHRGRRPAPHLQQTQPPPPSGTTPSPPIFPNPLPTYHPKSEALSSKIRDATTHALCSHLCSLPICNSCSDRFAEYILFVGWPRRCPAHRARVWLMNPRHLGPLTPTAWGSSVPPDDPRKPTAQYASDSGPQARRRLSHGGNAEQKNNP